MKNIIISDVTLEMEIMLKTSNKQACYQFIL